MDCSSGKVFLFALPLALIAGLISTWTQPAQAVSPNIVVSQVYSGGNSGASLKNDFIELRNRGAAAVDVTGWTVQYAATTGTSCQRTILSGIIQPGQYYLIQEAAGAWWNS